MDIQRKGVGRKKMIRRIIFIAVGVVALAGITLGINRLKPAAISVERATVWPDTVRRGPMVREVHGLGTLVPEDTLLIPAPTDGRIENRFILAGTPVHKDTLLMVMTNPELEQSKVDAEYQLKSAEAGYTDLKVQLESKGLDQKAVAAQVQSDFHQAKLKADRDTELAKQGLIPDLDMKLSTVKAEELSTRTKLEEQRLAIASQSVEAQLAEQKVKIEQLRALYDLKKNQVESLRVRAGTEGVMQQLLVEVGQRVVAGTPLAKVVQPWKLKAELKIPETQVKDVTQGQHAAIDTRNGIIPGLVSRIDPAAINGTVTVDVRLTGELPPGARPDLSVDGTIELEKLNDVVYMGRPVFGQPNSTITIFKVDPDGKGAGRVKVQLGRASVNTIEVLGGLRVGDQVILSDMSAYDSHDRIRLN